MVHLSETGVSKVTTYQMNNFILLSFQVGTWTREQGANFSLISTARGGLFNTTLIVTTIVVCNPKIKDL